MDSRFEYITSLQYQVKSLKGQVEAFRAGEKYIKMRAEFKARLDAEAKKIKTLTAELSAARSETVTVRKYWSEIFDDLSKEHRKELAKKDLKIKAMEERALRAERQRDKALDKLTGKRNELYQALTELEDEKGRNRKLKAQINHDYENSSIPSSMKPNHKKIANSREKTDRKPGGQPGHRGHERKRLIPTNKIYIPAPSEYTDNPEYRLTGKTITKQMINICVNVIVDEYSTPEFRNVRTGQRVHAGFPKGVANDVNYGGSVKAFAFLVNNRYCVSIEKTREFLTELTGGELQISGGMISRLPKVFSKKTESERKAMFTDLLLSPVMNTDFTAARLSGKNVQINICAASGKAMYFAREYKGHDGVKGTPVEDYQGIIVHDHDKTFYNYGSGHQECLAHSLRYLKDSMVNEPGLSWNKQMRELLREMIHCRNSIAPDGSPGPVKIKEYESRYLEILEIAKQEYEYEPPGKYYKDGYNLYRRLSKYMDNHRLFLYDKRVPATNFE